MAAGCHQIPYAYFIPPLTASTPCPLPTHACWGKVDAMKGQTLEDISALVNSITQDLKSRKER